MTRDETIAAMRGAFARDGRTLLPGGPSSISDRWIAWSTVHRAAALARYTDAALRAGCVGVFVRARDDGRGSVVGCLAPLDRR